MIVVVAFIGVALVASAWALCVLAKRGELRAAMFADRSSIDRLVAEREREQHLRASMRRHPAGKSRRP